ncbi:hypothetical protein [Bacillus sp. 37MA]|uniref:hypothetical protein n=1 Tax=Bacillus sp. 37MA TaxID=1132442 RepID=UPI000375AD6D|nr:hypothetical protein [Bacillus sp. 37MA]
MFNKTENSVKQDGNGNLAVQNSKITVNVSIFDEIARLGKAGDYNGVISLMSQVKDYASIQHPYYPHYTYKIGNFGDRISVEHEPRSQEVAEKLPLSYRGKLTIPPEQIKGFDNFGELIDDAFIKQRDIEIDVVALQALIDGEEVPTPFLEDNIKEAKWVIKPKPLPEPLKLKMYLKNDSEEITLVDYIEMGVSDLNKKESIMKIDNSRQEHSKLLVSVIIPFSDFKSHSESQSAVASDSKFSFTIKDEYKQDVEGNFLFFKLMQALSKYDQYALSFKNLINGTDFMKSSGFKLYGELDKEFENDFRFIERLYKIEQHFNLIFTLPEKIDDTDYEAIQVLESIIAEKPVQNEFTSLTLSTSIKESLNGIINSFEEEDYSINNFATEVTGDNMRIELFGSVVPLKKVRTTYSSLKLDDLEKIKRKYEDMDDGETVKVKFIPGESNKMEERFFPK